MYVKLWSRMGIEEVERDNCTPEVLIAAVRKLFKQKYGEEPTDIRAEVRA